MKIVTAQAMKVCVGDGGGTARALTTIEHGQLAKKLPGLQLRQRDLVQVFICYPDADRAFFDDVKRVTMIVLVKDHLAGLVIDLIDLLRELFQFMWLKAFEKRDPRQALRFFT